MTVPTNLSLRTMCAKTANPEKASDMLMAASLHLVACAYSVNWSEMGTPTSVNKAVKATIEKAKSANHCGPRELHVEVSLMMMDPINE